MSEQDKEVKTIIIDSMSALDEPSAEDQTRPRVNIAHSLHHDLKLSPSSLINRLINMSEEEIEEARLAYLKLRPPSDFSLTQTLNGIEERPGHMYGSDQDMPLRLNSLPQDIEECFTFASLDRAYSGQITETGKTDVDLNMITELVSVCTPENAEQVRGWYQGYIDCGLIPMIESDVSRDMTINTCPPVHITDETHSGDTLHGRTIMGQRVAVVGGSGLAKASLVSLLHGLKVEVATDAEGSFGNSQEYDMKGLSGIGAGTLLSGSQQTASPYASGSKPRDNIAKEPRRSMRKAQEAANKKNGYGKRLTKRDKAKLEAAKVSEGSNNG